MFFESLASFLLLFSLGSGSDVPRKLVKYEVPAYPAAAVAARARGEVKVDVRVDVDGRVVSAVPTSGVPMLRAAAADAARKWRFAPGEAATFEISIVFDVGGKTKARMRKPYRLEYVYRPPAISNTPDYDSRLLAVK